MRFRLEKFGGVEETRIFCHQSRSVAVAGSGPSVDRVGGELEATSTSLYNHRFDPAIHCDQEREADKDSRSTISISSTSLIFNTVLLRSTLLLGHTDQWCFMSILLNSIKALRRALQVVIRHGHVPSLPLSRQGSVGCEAVRMPLCCIAHEPRS
jgi:hypothetical protein